MSLPIEILENLLCSSCRKYLSVQPVKVYPNRSVKCGRCAEDDDGGTESFSYKVLIGKFNFPCINRYEGCTELLNCGSDFWGHEEKCETESYNCKICSKLLFSSYYLYLHIKESHKDDILTGQEFILNLDMGSQHKTFFYIQDNLLLCVLCQFDVDLCQIFLDISAPSSRRRVPLKQQFFIYTVNGVVKVKSPVKLCSNYDRIQGEGYIFNIDPKEFSKDVILIKFMVTEQPFLHFEKNRCVTVLHTFEGIEKLVNGQQLFSNIFYLANLPLNISVIKSPTLIPYAVNVYLNLLKKQTCEVNLIINLWSSVREKANRISTNCIKQDLIFDEFNSCSKKIVSLKVNSSAFGPTYDPKVSLTIQCSLKIKNSTDKRKIEAVQGCSNGLDEKKIKHT